MSRVHDSWCVGRRIFDCGNTCLVGLIRFLKKNVAGVRLVSVPHLISFLLLSSFSQPESEIWNDETETVKVRKNIGPKKVKRSRGGKTLQKFSMEPDYISKKGKHRGRRASRKRKWRTIGATDVGIAGPKQSGQRKTEVQDCFDAGGHIYAEADEIHEKRKPRVNIVV